MALIVACIIVVFPVPAFPAGRSTTVARNQNSERRVSLLIANLSIEGEIAVAAELVARGATVAREIDHVPLLLQHVARGDVAAPGAVVMQVDRAGPRREYRITLALPYRNRKRLRPAFSVTADPLGKCEHG